MQVFVQLNCFIACCWARPIVKGAQVSQICFNFCTVTHTRHNQSVCNFSWQCNCWPLQTVHCPMRRQEKKLVWNTRRTTAAICWPNTMSIPVVSNLFTYNMAIMTPPYICIQTSPAIIHYHHAMKNVLFPV